MPFVDRTEELIHGLDPAIQMAALTLVVAARLVGIPLMIISGRRSAALNADVGGAPNSWHLQGLAFDVAVYGYTRDQIPFAWWEQLGRWAEENLGLTWGGRFVHSGAPDVNHFDMRRVFRV